MGKQLTGTVAITYRLWYDENKSIAEIAQIRSMTKNTIENHISDALKMGMPCDPNRLPINRQQYDLINGIIDGPLKGDCSRLAPIKNSCPAKTSYFQIKCVLALRELKVPEDRLLSMLN
jgi:uncharacterized protein YpbB